ncbi:hypothetical protein BVRB_9g215200 [Beta vulgaris subsp. vulgaris]|nr:hypothetical protein BVRB_9g215200 [Beta vulgaris subsp. vulgaris]
MVLSVMNLSLIQAVTLKTCMLKVRSSAFYYSAASDSKSKVKRELYIG